MQMFEQKQQQQQQRQYMVAKSHKFTQTHRTQASKKKIKE